MSATIRAKVSTVQAEEVMKNVNIDGVEPYFTIIKEYENAITLNAGASQTMKKIRNEAGLFATVNCVSDTEWGGNDRIVLAQNSWVILCFAAESEEGSNRWYVLDRKDTGITLS